MPTDQDEQPTRRTDRVVDAAGLALDCIRHARQPYRNLHGIQAGEDTGPIRTGSLLLRASGRQWRSMAAQAFCPLPGLSSRDSMQSPEVSAQVLEGQLLAIWRRRLGLVTLNPDDSFVDVGGTSLAAMLLLADVERATGVRLAPRTMITAPTVRDQVALILGPAVASKQSGAGYITPVRTTGSQIPLLIVPGFGDTLVGIQVLADHLGPDQPLYVLDPTGFDPTVQVPDSFDSLIAAMGDEIRKLCRVGPLHVCGHSLGAHIAWALACDLGRSTHGFGALILLDTLAPGYPRKRSRGVRALLKLARASREGPAAVVSLLRERFARGLAELPGRSRLFDRETIAELTSAGRELEQRWIKVFEMTRRYRHETFRGAVHLIRASVHDVEPGVHDDDPAGGWARLALGGVQTLPISSSHTDVLKGEYAAELAGLLGRCLGPMPHDCIIALRHELIGEHP